jgi:hypothetical protein
MDLQDPNNKYAEVGVLACALDRTNMLIDGTPNTPQCFRFPSTITGSVANIIVVESASPEIEIGFWDYFRVGLPITIATLLLGSFWLA